MCFPKFLPGILVLAAMAAVPSLAFSQTAAPAGPYKIVKSEQSPGTGGIDYVFADSEGRRLYVPRGGEVLAFDLDMLKSVGSIPNARAHGVAVDPVSHRGFSSGNPVVMWDTQTLAVIKTIPVTGSPDGILFEPATERIYVFSHRQPNVTVLDGKEGAIVGTIDLGGAPEQAQSDGKGHLYVDVEDKDQIAVVDVEAMKVTARYDIGEKAHTPAGLGLDVKNKVLFAFCRQPASAVILGAEDGKILAALPIGSGTDGGGFNPQTMEAFSSQRDGTLTIIKENSPTAFEVAQTVQTKPGAKTCTLDAKENHIVLIALEQPAATPPPEASPAAASPTLGSEPAASPNAVAANPAPSAGQPEERRRGGGGRNNGPSLLDIIVVGR